MFWKNLISGQMDADRMDYLRRDSLHAGVSYGQYDWQRILNTIAVIPPSDKGDIRLGITNGGWHAAEGLILARYTMFSQVYFHKTRVAYNHHYQKALGEILPYGHFPSPSGAELSEYLDWDDWKVLGALKDGEGAEHGQRLLTRNHYRLVYETPETPSLEDLERLDKARGALNALLKTEMSASGSWYKTGPRDIDVVDESDDRIRPLSHYSKIIAHLEPSEQVLLYVAPEDVEAAKAAIREAVGGDHV